MVSVAEREYGLTSEESSYERMNPMGYTISDLENQGRFLVASEIKMVDKVYQAFVEWSACREQRVGVLMCLNLLRNVSVRGMKIPRTIGNQGGKV